jgi:hypothetical protein
VSAAPVSSLQRITRAGAETVGWKPRRRRRRRQEAIRESVRVCPDFVGPGRLVGQLLAVVLRFWDTPSGNSTLSGRDHDAASGETPRSALSGPGPGHPGGFHGLDLHPLRPARGLLPGHRRLSPDPGHLADPARGRRALRARMEADRPQRSALDAALRGLPGPAFRDLDHLPGIHDGGQLGGAGQPLPGVCGDCGPPLPSGDHLPSHGPGDLAGPGWERDGGPERRLHGISPPLRTGREPIPDRQPPGPGGSGYGGRLFHDRAPRARPLLPPGLYRPRLRDGGCGLPPDRRRRPSPLARLRAHDLRLDEPGGHLPPAHRTLLLQLGPPLPADSGWSP